MRSLFAFVVCSVSAVAAEHGYVGAQVCSGCHRDIAVSQAKTNMARTWQGTAAPQLPPDYSRTHSEAGVNYRVVRQGTGFDFQVSLPGRQKFTAPVETIVGGERHGLSFLYRVSEIDGLKLARPAL